MQNVIKIWFWKKCTLNSRRKEKKRWGLFRVGARRRNCAYTIWKSCVRHWLEDTIFTLSETMARDSFTWIFAEFSIVFSRLSSPLSFRLRRGSFWPPTPKQAKVSHNSMRTRVKISGIWWRSFLKSNLSTFAFFFVFRTPSQLQRTRIWSTIFWEGPQIHIKKCYAWEGQCQDWKIPEGTVRWKGSEGSKQTKHTTQKLTPCWFQNFFFFANLPKPFFGNVCFIKFGPFSALLALPVMIREEYGQMAHQTLPNILLSNASLVTKSHIARFVDDNAFNPSALSNCSTGPSPPLAHGKSTFTDRKNDTHFGSFKIGQKIASFPGSRWPLIPVYKKQFLPKIGIIWEPDILCLGVWHP